MCNYQQVTHILIIKSMTDSNGTNKCFKLKFCYLSIWRIIAILLTITITCSIVLLLKTYIKLILVWLEDQDDLIIIIVLIILFIIVSLPISIGYIFLIITVGYLFGLINGILLTIICVNFSLLLTNNLLKLLSRHHTIYRFIQNETAQAIMRVINGPLSFKIIFCARLTPIPFGLQNTIFALSNVNTKVYHLASMLGLLPAQIVGVYVGTTIRSMHDVLQNQPPIGTTTYFLISLQLILAVVLMFWLSTKARLELLKILAEAEETAGTAPNKTNSSTTFYV